MIVRVSLPLPLKDSFDYRSNFPLRKGMRILVDFRNRKEVGIVTGLRQRSSYTANKLKTVIEPLENIPSLPYSLLKFCRYLSRNYFCSYGESLKTALPLLLRTKKKIHINIARELSRQSLSQSQPKKKKRIYIREDFRGEKRFLLYKSQIKETINGGKQVIICLPRWQDVKRAAFLLGDEFKSHLAYLSSFQSPSRQFHNWLRIRKGEVSICLGTRMAIFAPFTNLGLIIVEGESFPGYFQPQKPFYNLRDIAWLLSQLTKSDFIISSDFFSLAAYVLLKENKFKLLDLRERKNITVKIFDLRNIRKRRYPVFSHLALGIIDKYLSNSKRVAVFWRRKGFSYFIRCRQCGYIAECPNCNIPFVYWKKESVLRCPRCEKKVKFSSLCPICQGEMLKYVGVGEERAESILRKNLPQAKVVSLSNSPLANDWNVVIGSQSEILSLPLKPELVIASGVDSLFSQEKLNAAEEGFLLLFRLREVAREEMVVFTFLPAYYPFIALQKGEEWFYKKELIQRKRMKLPPYFYLIEVNIRSKVEKVAERKYQELLSLFTKVQKNLSFYLYELGYTKKLRGNFYYTCVLKAKRRSTLNRVWERVGSDFRPGRSKISLSLI